eukprot:scpid74824/ scgid18790/ 
MNSSLSQGRLPFKRITPAIFSAGKFHDEDEDDDFEDAPLRKGVSPHANPAKRLCSTPAPTSASSVARTPIDPCARFQPLASDSRSSSGKRLQKQVPTTVTTAKATSGIFRQAGRRILGAHNAPRLRPLPDDCNVPAGEESLDCDDELFADDNIIDLTCSQPVPPPAVMKGKRKAVIMDSDSDDNCDDSAGGGDDNGPSSTARKAEDRDAVNRTTPGSRATFFDSSDDDDDLPDVGLAGMSTSATRDKPVRRPPSPSLFSPVKRRAADESVLEDALDHGDSGGCGQDLDSIDDIAAEQLEAEMKDFADFDDDNDGCAAAADDDDDDGSDGGSSEKSPATSTVPAAGAGSPGVVSGAACGSSIGDDACGREDIEAEECKAPNLDTGIDIGDEDEMPLGMDSDAEFDRSFDLDKAVSDAIDNLNSDDGLGDATLAELNGAACAAGQEQQPNNEMQMELAPDEEDNGRNEHGIIDVDEEFPDDEWYDAEYSKETGNGAKSPQWCDFLMTYPIEEPLSTDSQEVRGLLATAVQSDWSGGEAVEHLQNLLLMHASIMTEICQQLETAGPPSLQQVFGDGAQKIMKLLSLRKGFCRRAEVTKEHLAAALETDGNFDDVDPSVQPPASPNSSSILPRGTDESTGSFRLAAPQVSLTPRPSHQLSSPFAGNSRSPDLSKSATDRSAHRNGANPYSSVHCQQQDSAIASSADHLSNRNDDSGKMQTISSTPRRGTRQQHHVADFGRTGAAADPDAGMTCPLDDQLLAEHILEHENDEITSHADDAPMFHSNNGQLADKAGGGTPRFRFQPPRPASTKPMTTPNSSTVAAAATPRSTSCSSSPALSSLASSSFSSSVAENRRTLSVGGPRQQTTLSSYVINKQPPTAAVSPVVRSSSTPAGSFSSPGHLASSSAAAATAPDEGFS